MKKVLLSIAAVSMFVVAIAGCTPTGTASNSSAGTSSSTTSSK